MEQIPTISARRSIKWKIIGFLVAIFVLLGLSFSWYIPNKSKKLIESSLKDKGISLVKILAANSKTGIYVESGEKLKDILESMANDTDVIYVEVYTSSGKKIASKVKGIEPDPLNIHDLKGIIGTKITSKANLVDFLNPVIRETSVRDEKSILDMAMIDEEYLEETPDEDVELKSETIGFVRLGLDLKPIMRKRGEILRGSATFTTLLFIAALILAYLFISSITRRIKSIATMAMLISRGDLTKKIPERGGSDEIDLLANAFNAMVAGLSMIVKKISDSANFLTDATGEFMRSGERLTKGAKSQEDEIHSTVVATTDLTESINEIAGSSKEVENSTSDISLSISRMDTSIKEMNINFSSLAEAVTNTASAISEINASIREIASRAVELKKISNESTSSIIFLSRNIEDVTKRSKEASSLSKDAESSAEAGVDSLDKTVESIKEISDSFKEVKENISLLDEEIIGITEIVKVIDDVVKKTHLLSLNAAIIASRVMDQGKEFRVVAEEIKRLAAFTTEAIAKIEDRVSSIQEKSENVGKAIEKGESRVKKGVRLGSDTDRAFSEILSKLKISADTIENISLLTESQMVKTREVNAQTEMVAKMADAISSATGEEVESITFIKRTSDNMKIISDEVSRMVTEQAEASASIAKSMESITGMAKSLKESQDGELNASKNIEMAMEKLEDQVRESKENIMLMDKKVQELDQLGGRLQEEVNKFKI